MEAVETAAEQGMGLRLRRAREQRGLSVEECAERLYLPVTVLEALESEQFAMLGAGVFARGHLRRYAALLDLDATTLEQMIVQRLAAAPDLASIATRRVGDTRPKRRMGLMPVAIVAAALALAVLIWWSVRHAAETAPASTPVATPLPAPATGHVPMVPATPEPPAPRVALAPRTGNISRAGMPAPPVRAKPEAPRPDAPLVIAEAPRARRAEASPTPAMAPQAAPDAPQRPQQSMPARETQRDYMNFDY